MKALRIFTVMSIGVVLAMGLFACGDDKDNGSSTGNSGAADYSQYSGFYTVNYTITDSSDSFEIGGTGTWTGQLKVTPAGYATAFCPNAYCGEVLSSGIFNGNTVNLPTAADGWKCGIVTCCGGRTITKINFIDANNGTLSRRSTSCCSSKWQEISGTLARQ